ncbi:MAG: hypothetical protein IMY70_04075 [Bacteroidetes bacterium]|nr:hypothetical protein [Bacteroidota bacterium]
MTRMLIKNYRYCFISYIVLTVILLHSGCKKDDDENISQAYVNITIDPNSTEYQNLNVVGGWLYLIANPPSRGIIVYRLYQDEFKAYDRKPPYLPDECCNSYGCTRLIVDLPFVMDTCTVSTFQIIDGSPVDGPANVQLIQYKATYDGQLLYITN